jgi:hypothetical protein
MSGSTVEQGYYFQSGDIAVTYPALAPDGQGNLIMLFERMGHDVFPETRLIKKDAGEANFKGAGAVLKAGESSYRPHLCGTTPVGATGPVVCRWGDYEAASFDGQGRLWFAGEYANQFMDTTQNGQGRFPSLPYLYLCGCGRLRRRTARRSAKRSEDSRTGRQGRAV